MNSLIRALSPQYRNPKSSTPRLKVRLIPQQMIQPRQQMIQQMIQPRQQMIQQMIQPRQQTPHSYRQIMAVKQTPNGINKLMAASHNGKTYNAVSLKKTSNNKKFTKMRLSSNDIDKYLRRFNANKLHNNNNHDISNYNTSDMSNKFLTYNVKPLIFKINPRHVKRSLLVKKPVKKPVKKSVGVKRRTVKK